MPDETYAANPSPFTEKSGSPISLAMACVDIGVQFLLIERFDQISERLCLFCPFDIFMVGVSGKKKHRDIEL